MAAKKKANSSDNNKKGRTSPANSGKKGAPKKEDPKVSDDNFGLDDIDDLNAIEDSTEDIELVEEIKKEDKKPEITVLVDEREVIKEKEERKAVVANITTDDHPKSSAKQTKVVDEKKIVMEKKSDEEKKGGGVWIVILIVIIVALAIYFFAFSNKEEPKPVVEPKPKVEQPKAEPEPEPEPVKAIQPKAELITISVIEGRYYAVVGSFFDGDLAEDKGNELVKSGTTAYVLMPKGNAAFTRVGLLISNVSSIGEAEARLAPFREKYGNEVWVLKY